MIAPALVTVPSSAAPVFDGRRGRTFRLVLTTDAAATFQNFLPGLLYAVEIEQDGMGGHLLSFPLNVLNAGEVSTAPGARTAWSFTPRRDGKLYATSNAILTPGS